MDKTCPHCGAALPGEASFCPHCGESLHRRRNARMPRRVPARLLRALALLCLAVLLSAAAFFYLSPKVYEEAGEVSYTDADGTYQLVSNVSTDRFYPMPEIAQDAGEQESYRFPLRLYISHRDSGADASGIFLQKASDWSLEVYQPADSAWPVKASEPQATDAFPGTALVSYIDFSRESKGPIELVWTLHMNNRDTIRIRSALTVTPIHTYRYNSQNADLADSRALQSLIDQLARETNHKDVVAIELPAVTYDAPLILHSRSFSLTGTETEGKRTTFTAGIQMRAQADDRDWISDFTGIDFVGDGTGVGISAANRVRTTDCRFFNWKTALLSYGDTWVNTMDCLFEGNGTGLYYNSDGGSHSDTRFTGNTFRSNGTAVLLENVSGGVRMDFTDCRFEGNGTDIDNRCQQPVDISHAIFQ